MYVCFIQKNKKSRMEKQSKTFVHIVIQHLYEYNDYEMFGGGCNFAILSLYRCIIFFISSFMISLFV